MDSTQYGEPMTSIVLVNTYYRMSYIAFVPSEPHFRHFVDILCCQIMYAAAALLKKIKLKIAIKHCVLLCNMLYAIKCQDM